MPLAPLLSGLLAYGLALWLGFYLLSRDARKPALLFAGLGAVAYALSLATDLLAVQAGPAQAAGLFRRLNRPFLLLPALFWLGTAVHLVPESHPWRQRLRPAWRWIMPVAALLLFLLATTGDLLFDHGAGQWAPLGLVLLVGGGLLALLLALAIIRHAPAYQPRVAVGVIILATLFFTLGGTLLLLPQPWLPRFLLLLGIGGDLAALGLAVAVLDAFEEGEGLRLDMARSFGSAALITILFSGQVGLVIALSTGLTWPLLLLLLAIMATALLSQTFADRLQAALDWLLLARVSGLRQERQTLRATAAALPRRRPASRLLVMEAEEFARLTRRAFSHLDDLPRLASNPLIHLPQVDRRLETRPAAAVATGSLARAAELKTLLTERVLLLKPRDQGDFGAGDAWRHYNALYFPYVLGLKPYRRRPVSDQLSPLEHEALDWFRANVPERTLYNWQSAAARQIAADLYTEMRSLAEVESGLPLPETNRRPSGQAA